MGIYVQRGILIVVFAVLLVVSLEHYVGNIVGFVVGCYGLLYGFASHEPADGQSTETDERTEGDSSADTVD